MDFDPATGQNRALFERFHIDLPLLLGILVLMGFGLVVMYSASGQSLAMMDRQAMRMGLSLGVMVILAQIPPRTYESLAPLMFIVGVLLLFGVLFFGEASKGAQRWLNLGFVRFQPSELLKLAVPLMVARFIGKRSLPPNVSDSRNVVGDGLCTNHFDRQTARFRHFDSDCRLRNFRYLPCRHQLENHLCCGLWPRRIFANLVVLPNEGIPESPSSYSVQPRV